MAKHIFQKVFIVTDRTADWTKRKKWLSGGETIEIKKENKVSEVK